MIASLGMYDRPETADAHDALWQGIASRLPDAPAQLDRDADMWSVWQSSELLLSQTCGLPYRARLHDQVTLVGTPHYDLPDCAPGQYFSVLVAHKDRAGDDIAAFDGARFAYNEALSQSGWAAPLAYLAKHKLRPGPLVQTGAHRNSAIAVAEGQADFAALDAVTWALITRHDDFASTLTVIAKTDPTPGLPLITGAGRDKTPIFEAVHSAISDLAPRHRDALFLKSLVAIPKEDYLAQPIPPHPDSL